MPKPDWLTQDAYDELLADAQDNDHLAAGLWLYRETVARAQGGTRLRCLAEIFGSLKQQTVADSWILAQAILDRGDDLFDFLATGKGMPSRAHALYIFEPIIDRIRELEAAVAARCADG